MTELHFQILTFIFCLHLTLRNTFASEGNFEYVEGPEVWEDVCETGLRQSPINIISNQVDHSSSKIIYTEFVGHSEIDLCLDHLTLKTGFIDSNFEVKKIGTSLLLF